MIYLTVLVALIISAVSAFYSVVGLTAIFPGAVLSIIVMGASLEAGKVVTALWVHRHWNEIGWYRGPFVASVVVLMLINSLGMFGFLSKAHLEQKGKIADSAVVVEQLKVQLDPIVAQIEQLEREEKEVRDIVARYTQLGSVTKGVKAKKEYDERLREINTIRLSLIKEKAELETALTNASAVSESIKLEVGPILYAAALIYGEDGADDRLESAVRLLILTIIFVFDPLALLLLLSAQKISSQTKKGNDEPPSHDFDGPPPTENSFNHTVKKTTTTPVPDPVDTKIRTSVGQYRQMMSPGPLTTTTMNRQHRRRY